MEGSYTIQTTTVVIQSPVKTPVKTYGEAFHMRKRIGSTVYEVSARFNPEAKETINDKILRLIKNDLNTIAASATMVLPQTVRLPERGSL